MGFAVVAMASPIFFGSLVFSFEAAAQASAINHLISQTSQLQAQIDALSSKVYQQGLANQGNRNQSGGTNVEVRLNGFETELRNLTGQLERMTFELRQVKQRNQDFESRMTARMNQLEESIAQVGSAPTYQNNATNQQTATVVEHQSSVQSSAQSDAQRDAQAAASVYLNSSSGLDAGADGSSFQSTTQSAAQGASETPGFDPYTASMPLHDADGGQVLASASPSSKAAYEAAYALVQQSRYREAQSAFQNYLNTYPQSPLAGNAAYWLGEAQYSLGDYNGSAIQFAENFRNHQNGNKAPDNLLKLALSLDRLGRREEACGTLVLISSRYAANNARITNRANSERARLSC